MTVASELPPADYIKESLWAGGANSISYKLTTKVGEVPTVYELELAARPESQVVVEELTVGTAKVISVQNGRGKVRDEGDVTKVTPYRPTKPRLALKSAGDYGDKPITSALTEFIQNWGFYYLKPEEMRRGIAIAQQSARDAASDLPKILSLDRVGRFLSTMLYDWYKNDRERFQSVDEALKTCFKLGIGQRISNGEDELGLLEGYDNLVPLSGASDGTLRFAAYQILLHQPEIPSLIAIEEPERNLHPAALKDIANVLERLAERTQVVITTHSSQLLDAFNPASLSDNLGVLLLQNIAGQGTKVTDLNDARKDQTALDGWITDFGIGSALFDSELLQEPLESEPCQV